MIYIKIIKPLLDWSIAFLLIVLLFPCWLVGILIIKFFQGSPLFFLQKRTGLKMRAFTLYKIRTLEVSSNTSLSLKDRKFTRAGRFLRKTGLDEFPQLINVIKGDMSLIGPRPMPVAYEKNYDAMQIERFECKPGITGWAQVNGRNTTSWNDRFALDIWYLNHCSFWLDLKIAGLTVVQLLKRDSNEIEMPVFTGSNLT